MPMKPAVLVIACGALAHELTCLQRRNRWSHLQVRCLPPELHNRPERIPGAVLAAIDRYGAGCRSIFVAFADCGTGGRLDRVLRQRGIERLPGAHCYEVFSGRDRFRALSRQEPGTFYLTDFLVRHFDRLVWRGLGLDRHPQLRSRYFGHYHRAVLLSQVPSPELSQAARACAASLGLGFEEYRTGLEPLRLALEPGISACRS